LTTLTLFKNGVLASCALALALLSGCGKAQDTSSHEAVLSVDAQATDYVARFERSSAEYGASIAITDLIVRFGQVDADGEGGGRGVCEYSAGNTPVITLSQSAWDSSSDADREELVFHELGHCVLMKRHEAGLLRELGIPKSLMNPTKIDGSVYRQNKNYYLSSLFAQ
jgi:hypothetical protein